MSFSTTKILTLCTAAGLAFTAATSFGQVTTLVSPTVDNGGFNSGFAAGATNQINFPVAASPTGTVPYWGSTLAGGDADSGVAPGPGNTTEEGTAGAYLKYGEGTFNLVTTRTIKTGDVYTLTFYAQDTGGSTGPVIASLFSETPANAAAGSYTPIATLATQSYPLLAQTGQNNFTQFTLTYTALAANAGSDIGINITNGSTITYDGVDNVVLTVVPEPSTYALLALGVAGLLFVRRRMLA